VASADWRYRCRPRMLSCTRSSRSRSGTAHVAATVRTKLTAASCSQVASFSGLPGAAVLTDRTNSLLGSEAGTALSCLVPLEGNARSGPPTCHCHGPALEESAGGKRRICAGPQAVVCAQRRRAVRGAKRTASGP
jgi:hypothetical protein